MNLTFSRVRRRLGRAVRELRISDIDRALLVDPDRPIFLHKPGGPLSSGILHSAGWRFGQVARAVRQMPGRASWTHSPRIAYITYNNRSGSTLFEQAMDRIEPGKVAVVARDFHPWNWFAKVGPVLEHLKALDKLPEYVLGADGSDVLPIHDPSLLEQRFHEYEADIVFCNTVADWPPAPELAKFELERSLDDKYHCHVSAGAYMARTEFLMECLGEISQAYHERAEWALYKGSFDDQLAWRVLHHRHHPRIVVDGRCRLFKRYDIFRGLGVYGQHYP